MARKISYRQKTIEQLTKEGYDPANAKRLAQRLYNQAYRSLRGDTKSKDINIEFEVYASVSQRKKSPESTLFLVGIGNEGIETNVRLRFEGVNLYTAYVEQRLSAFARSYSEVDAIVKAYSRGEISLSELNAKIKEFKQNNQDYLRNKGGS